MSDRFSGKTVMVTGGAGGLGRAIAEAFANDGAAIVLVDMDGDRLAATSAEMAAQGTTVSTITANLSQEADIAAVAEQFAQSNDKLDILVNNAGIAYGETSTGFFGLGMDKWQHVMAVNTLAPLLLAEVLRPQLAAANGALIINQCSMAAYMPATAYGVTKAALAAVNFGLATQLSGDGVRSVGIAPGLMATEANAEHLPAAQQEQLRSMQLNPKRGGTAQDIANTCVFLASDEGGFINNMIVNVDGGHQMRGWHI